MPAEQEESQEPWVGEKVYPNPGTKPTTHIVLLGGGIVGAVLGVLLRMYTVDIVEALYDIALRSTVNNFQNLGLGMAIVFSAYIVGYLIVILGGFLVEEIALTKAGVVFKRRRSSTVIQKITSMQETSKGRVLKLTGSTPEGKLVNRRVTWADVDKKRWQEFKNDLQRITSSDSIEPKTQETEK